MFVAALNANDRTMYDWIVNCGATQHMTFEQEGFPHTNAFPQGRCSWAMTPFGGHWQGELQSHNASGRQIVARNHHPSSSCSKNEK